MLELLQYRKNKVKLRELIKSRPEYQHMDLDSLEVLSVLLNAPKLWEAGMKSGIQKGITTGIEGKTRQIVTNMLKRGMADEDIKVITECPQETIDILRRELRF